MKKMLFITNICGNLSNMEIPSIELAEELGYEFHFASNFSEFEDEEIPYDISLHHIDSYRNPFHPFNVRAYRQLCRLIEQEGFDIIHCNTPIGGVLGRLAGNHTRIPHIIYTAHGFHFYQGAPLFNRLVLKNAEAVMARMTTSLITMNEEDYQAARRFRLKKGGQVYRVSGVGVNTRFVPIPLQQQDELRQTLGVPQNALVLISMGEMIKRKNYAPAIQAVAKAGHRELHYLICGEGPEEAALKKLARELGVADRIHFLGHRNDINDLLNIADIFLFTTLQEGLPRSMMEAMAAGLPCVVSKVRGNVDLTEEGKGALFQEPNDSDGYARALDMLAVDAARREMMGRYNRERVKNFDVDTVKRELRQIYQKEMAAETAPNGLYRGI